MTTIHQAVPIPRPAYPRARYDSSRFGGDGPWLFRHRIDRGVPIPAHDWEPDGPPPDVVEFIDTNTRRFVLGCALHDTPWDFAWGREL